MRLCPKVSLLQAQLSTLLITMVYLFILTCVCVKVFVYKLRLVMSMKFAGTLAMIDLFTVDIFSGLEHSVTPLDTPRHRDHGCSNKGGESALINPRWSWKIPTIFG